MSEEKIKELMKVITNLRYRPKDYDSDFRIVSCNDEGLMKLENVIRKFLLDNRDKELGELKAKVYAYEKIIANSNFAPILRDNTKELTNQDESYITRGE